MASRRCPFSTPPDPPGLLELSLSSAFFGCRPNFHKQIRQHFLASTQSDTSPRLPFDLFFVRAEAGDLDHKPGRKTLHIRSQARRVPIRKLTSFRSANSRLYFLAHST